MNSELKQKLDKLPASPGVYFHYNKDGEVIYVGKAAVLKINLRFVEPIKFLFQLFSCEYNRLQDIRFLPI